MKKLTLAIGIASLIIGCNRAGSTDNVLTDNSTTSTGSTLRTVISNSETSNSVTASAEVDSNQALFKDFYGIGGRSFSGDGWKCIKGATVTQTTTGNTTITTIDYGTTGVTDEHGNVKAGKIIITQTGTKGTLPFTRSVAFSGYSLNGNTVTGNINFSTVLNASGNPETTRSVDITTTLADGSGTITEKGTFVRTMTAGYSTTDNISDDVWQETGSAAYTDPKGTYTVSIASPLIFSVSCGYITSGIKEINLNGKTYKIDYGAGTCDNSAIVTFPDGSTMTVSLEPKKKH